MLLVKPQMVGLIKRTFSYLTKDIFLKLYKALVRPHLEYGNIVWNPFLKRQSIAIERVQRRATRLLKECQGLTYAERLKYLDLHSLKGRRLRGDLIEAFKIFNDENQTYPAQFFPSAPYTNTRNSDRKIYKEHCHTNIRKNYFRFRITNHWNSLKPNLKFAHDTNTFKNLLDNEQKFMRLFYEYDE